MTCATVVMECAGGKSLALPIVLISDRQVLDTTQSIVRLDEVFVGVSQTNDQWTQMFCRDEGELGLMRRGYKLCER